ncbi:hypothetical protein Tco_0262440 [Tanacetum coccineum]
MKEREVQAIKEIEKWLKESEMQTQESLVSKGATLEASLVIEGATLEASLQNEINSSRSESGSSQNDANADIGHSYDSDTVFEIPTNVEIRNRGRKIIILEKKHQGFELGNEQRLRARSDLAQQTKDFEDAKVDFSKKTDKFEIYFEKIEKTRVVLERQLDHKIQDSKAEKDQFLKQIAFSKKKNCGIYKNLLSIQKEYIDLRTSYNALKANFDSLNWDKGKSLVSNFPKLTVSVSKKIYVGKYIQITFKRGSP